MRRKGLLAVAVVLLLALVTPLQAATPKAGAKCTKVGATVTAAGKKFTCVKSGTKLVWNKGVAVKAAPKPQVVPAVPPTVTPPQPEQKVEPKISFALDPRITQRADLTAVEMCRTADQTPDMRPEGIVVHRNGFPRPMNSLYGKKSARLLVIPMSFNDLAFRAVRDPNRPTAKSDLEALEEVIPYVKDSFKKASAGRFAVEIDVLPQSEWWVFNQNNPVVIGPLINNFPKIMDLVTTQKSTFKFDVYDSYIFISGVGVPGQPGIGAGQAFFGEKNKNGKDGSFNAVLMTGIWTNSGIWLHELGHSLFAFEDLYLFDQTLDPGKGLGLEFPNKWDLMANANLIELLGWNKFLMGWLEDSEVRCLSDQKTSIHYLTSDNAGKESKLLTINLAPGVTLAAESRKASSSESGLLLSFINTNTNHGQGPVLAQRFLMTKGDSKSLLGWRISVLESDTDGVLIEAIKTDIDKFVPPPLRPQQSGPPQPSSPIKVTKGEVVPNGYLKGRATWEVSGHQSFRVYVTAVDDLQKVYFESGYVNDNRSSLVMEISGLVCNKELRTMTEFYTEKDGKGERLVMPSMGLSFLSCEDTTRKP
jgi:M6 family metalloprotease-like protein